MGSSEVSAMALASPVVEPPPIATQQSTCSAARLIARRFRDRDRNMHHGAVEHARGSRAQHHDDIGADGALFGSAQHQCSRDA